MLNFFFFFTFSFCSFYTCLLCYLSSLRCTLREMVSWSRYCLQPSHQKQLITEACTQLNAAGLWLAESLMTPNVRSPFLTWSPTSSRWGWTGFVHATASLLELWGRRVPALLLRSSQRRWWAGSFPAGFSAPARSTTLTTHKLSSPMAPCRYRRCSPGTWTHSSTVRRCSVARSSTQHSPCPCRQRSRSVSMKSHLEMK